MYVCGSFILITGERTDVPHIEEPVQHFYELNTNNMKKINFRTASLWMMGAVTSILLATGCKSKDYKETDATSDSLQARITADSLAALQSTTVTTVDTPGAVISMSPTTNEPTIGIAKPNPKKKKGKGSAQYIANKNWEAQYNKLAMEMDKEGIYSRTEIKPSYPGGEAALAKFIQNNIEYPERALDEGVEGTVDVMFAVDENGKVYTPFVKGSRQGYGLDEEATKVVSRMPRWNPGQIKGKNVKSYYTLPISFQIQ